MDYIKDNKAAWEEAFEHRQKGWGDDIYERLLKEELPFFCTDVKKELQSIDFTDKRIAQFCCNNGRELLSLMQLGARQGTGFDIAENIIAQAKATAKKAAIENCEFVAVNILDIPDDYDEQFDFILFTIGAITWFEDLPQLFKKVAACLKPGGVLFIHDFHPFMNMLPMPEESAFDENDLQKIAYSYFRKEPWIEHEGMSYMSEIYESKPFTSFSHTMADIINAIAVNQMQIQKLQEYDYDIGLSDVYDHRGLPLSYVLIAHKEQ